jgi:hypothetical protein
MQSDKAKTAAIIAIVLMITSITIMAMSVQSVNADVVQNVQPSGGVTNIPPGVTPNYTIQPVIYLSVSPTPVGINEYLLINIWQTPPLQASRYYANYKVTITKPDGTTDSVTMNSYYGDGTAWFNYVVDQIGTWKFDASFPGAYYTAGNYTSTAIRSGGGGVGETNPQATQNILWDTYPYSTYYKPSTTQQTTKITVQQQPVYQWPQSALPGPGQYWTRPVEPMNKEWWSILGNYPFEGPGGGTGWPADTNLYSQVGYYQFTPWVTAPNSAHIVWKQQGAIGGLVGPTAMVGQIVTENWQASPGSPTMCYAGRCYQTITKAIDNKPTSVWECYDLRTGQVYWDLTGISAPQYIEYSKGAGDTPGATAIRFEDVNLVYIGGGRLIKYNPYTGAVNLNMSISPLTTGTYYMNGYCLSVQDLGANATNAIGGRYRLINWTTLNNGITTFVGSWVTTQPPTNAGTGFSIITQYTGRIVTNSTYASSSLPSLIDYQAGYGATVGSISNPGSLVQQQTTVAGYNLATGQQLWNTTVDDPAYSGGCNQADHGKIAVKFKSGYYRAWDLVTGNLAWTSDRMMYPWDQCGFGAYNSQSAYGLLYNEAYSGVYAFNWSTGKIQWKFEAIAPDWETPYTNENGTQVYSWDSGGKLADGKLFVCNSEHSPSSPVTRGWSLYAINVTTGTEVWHMLGEMDAGVIADGYMTAANTYDGYMYVFGMGKSATTVRAPDVSVPLGTAFMIKGTVLDMSPAQSGTPCVSQDSMATQMAYLHMQEPIAGIWGNETIYGVPVTLTAIDENGTYTNIATVATNGYAGDFSYAWTPKSTGTYQIIATFAGDYSYGSSIARTAVTVAPAPATPSSTASNNASNAPDNTMLLYGILAAVVIAIVIGLVAVLLSLRKR